MAQPQANLRPIAPQRGLASRDGTLSISSAASMIISKPRSSTISARVSAARCGARVTAASLPQNGKSSSTTAPGGMSAARDSRCFSSGQRGSTRSKPSIRLYSSSCSAPVCSRQLLKIFAPKIRDTRDLCKRTHGSCRRSHDPGFCRTSGNHRNGQLPHSLLLSRSRMAQSVLRSSDRPRRRGARFACSDSGARPNVRALRGTSVASS
jgi:hypothetical protein